MIDHKISQQQTANSRQQSLLEKKTNGRGIGVDSLKMLLGGKDVGEKDASRQTPEDDEDDDDDGRRRRRSKKQENKRK